MRSSGLVRWAAAIVVSVTSACSLFVSLDGLENGNSVDGSVVDASEAEAACPSGGGPSMVSLSYGYCIDSTEVSQSQYQAFLNAIHNGYVPPPPPLAPRE